jgi:hypothetical protein
MIRLPFDRSINITFACTVIVLAVTSLAYGSSSGKFDGWSTTQANYCANCHGAPKPPNPHDCTIAGNFNATVKIATEGGDTVDKVEVGKNHMLKVVLVPQPGAASSNNGGFNLHTNNGELIASSNNSLMINGNNYQLTHKNNKSTVWPFQWNPSSVGNHTLSVCAQFVSNGDSCNKDGPVSCTNEILVFEPHTLTVKAAGSGMIRFSSSDSSVINCRTTCPQTYDFPEVTQVTLTATPDENFEFTGWDGGGCDDTKLMCDVSLTPKNQTVTANFEPKPKLTVKKTGRGQGTVTSSSGGVNLICGGDCPSTEAYYNDGTSVTLTAMALFGSVFTRWSVASCGTNMMCTVEMTRMQGDQTIIAEFTPLKRTLTVSKVMTGAGDGTVKTSDSIMPSINCAPGCRSAMAEYDHGTSVKLEAMANPGFFFRWGGDCADFGTAMTCTVTMTQESQTVTATFAEIPPNHSLLTVKKAGNGKGTIESNPAGIVCGPICTESGAIYPNNTMVTLTARAQSGSEFIGWSVASCGTNMMCAVTITASQTVIAHFRLQPQLTVKKAGTGKGTVTSSPAGIACGPTCPEATASYNTGTSVALTAQAADANAHFTGWDGGGCSGTGMCIVPMTESQTVTATFDLVKRQLTVKKAGAGDGTVTSSPPGIACGATCSAQYDNGTRITLTAATNASAVFAGWNGGDCSGTRTCSVSMTQDTTVTATFAQNLRPIADAGPDQEVDESLEGLPSIVTLDGSASKDPDGTIASYTWSQTEGPPVVLDNATIARPKFTAPVVGVLEAFAPGDRLLGASESRLRQAIQVLEAFAPGDRLPGFVLSPSRGGVTPEIQAHGTYADGKWTVMFTRPLMTSDADGDAQFDFTDPANAYSFSIAYLDNTGAASPLGDAAAVMSTQDTRAYTLGNATSGADLRAAQETPRDCSSFTGAPLETSPASPSVVPALTLRAAYDSANVYLCVEAPDPNGQADEDKELWEFVGPAPTDWRRLPGSVNVMGGEAGAFDEDRLALWWNINAQDFATQGCAALCHDGRMRSRNADGRADLWYWQAARTNPVGFAEDQRLDPDRTRCPDTPCRQLDADTLPSALANSRSYDSGTLPAYVAHTVPEADVRFLIDGEVPSHCPGETCAPAVRAALIGERLTFKLTVTDNHGLMSEPDSVTITIRDTDHDEDSDGVRDITENGAPNNGDGNNDGIQDSLQPHVTSLPNSGDQGYITLVSPEGTALAAVRFLPNPPAAAPTDLRFPLGFLVFTVLDVPPGGAVTVTLLPPPNTSLAADAFYYKYGPTPETPEKHFYTFTFDGTTGAEILPDRIQLHLIDGARGDHDLAADGQITDPGAVAIAAPPLPNVERDGGSGGGCSILPGGQRAHSRPGDALGNILLPVLAMLILYGWRRVTARPTLQRFFRAASGSKPPGADGSGCSSHDIFLTKEADND